MCNIDKLYSQLKCVGSRFVTPVVAIVIEKPSQLANSLANHPIRIEFEVNQVSFTCELATALHVA